MKRFRGIVINKVVVLEESASLPEGAEVEVSLMERPVSREEVFARLRANRIHRHVGIDEIIEEDKKEREERADQWLR